MGAESYSALIAHIHDLETQLAVLQGRTGSLGHRLEEEQKVSARRLTQLKTLQTLSMGVFSVLETTEIYHLACESLVHQMEWDVAWVVGSSAKGFTVVAQDHATEKQLKHLQEFLGQNQYLSEAFAHHTSLISRHSQEAASLSLRSLFQVEELAAFPILHGDHCFGYLVVGETQTHRVHTDDEIDFLATVATLLAYAIQQSTSMLNLEAQNAKLRQLDELKDSFISITSHQLRTPLSIIKWILSILQTDKVLAEMPEPLKLIQQAYATNERLIHVVNDLLNVSRIQEGKLPYNPQLSDLTSVVTELLDNVEPLFQSKNIRLERHLSHDLPLMPLDPILFKEAVQNLVNNAMDYNLDSGGWVKISATKQDNQIELIIENPGTPVTARDFEQIFEQFYRSPQAVSQHPNGNGLGLFLARAIVQAHGGKLELKKSDSESTIFMIQLPLPVQVAIKPGAHILIVEDEELLAQLMKQQLETAGYAVEVAYDGQMAWESIKTNPPQIILTDLLMPKMSGYELLEKLRQNDKTKTIPCLVLSNSGQADDLNRAYSLGAQDVLIKANFNPDQLIGKVAVLITKMSELENQAAAV